MLYDKLLASLAENCTELTFDFSKFRNPFSEEISNYILNNSIMTSAEAFLEDFSQNRNALKLSLPILLNFKTNLKNTPSAHTRKYI